MQEGIVLFTIDFERYLKEKLSKQVKFVWLFKAWRTEWEKNEVF